MHGSGESEDDEDGRAYRGHALGSGLYRNSLELGQITT